MNTHWYTGQERDANTGLDYMHFRYYSASLGRFMKADNIGGGNLYCYVGGNPVGFSDPTGHFRGSGVSVGSSLPYTLPAGMFNWESASENQDREGAGDTFSEFCYDRFGDPNFFSEYAWAGSPTNPEFTGVISDAGNPVFDIGGGSTPDIIVHPSEEDDQAAWGLSLMVNLLPLAAPNEVSGFLLDRIYSRVAARFWVEHKDAEVCFATLTTGLSFLGTAGNVAEAAAIVAEDQALVASGVIAEASFDYGVLASGIALGPAIGFGLVSASGGYVIGWGINYVLPEGAKEGIGDGELAIGTFFG